jgi:hypothetical protein
MIGRKEEAEVIIRLDQQGHMAHICVSAWPALYRKILRLHGQSRDGASPQHSARWIVPMEAILIRKGKKRTAPGMGFGARKAHVQPQSGETNAQ